MHLPAAWATKIEEIIIVANQEDTNPVTNHSYRVLGKEEIIYAPSLASRLSVIPGVALNGQGGSLQSYSIRGMARWRIQTRIAGIPLSTERPAGNSASFIHPWLIESIYVAKGPTGYASGSGAMGGVINIKPRWFHHGEIEVSYFTQGATNHMSMGWGNEQASLGLVGESGSGTRDSSGNPFNDSFRNLSSIAAWKHHFSSGARTSLYLISGEGRSLGKSSSDYPLNRITTYPEQDRHLLIWQFDGQSDWHARLWAQNQALDTRVVNADSVSLSNMSSEDSGVTLYRNWQMTSMDFRLGLEVLNRQQIRIKEQQILINNADTISSINLNAQQIDEGIYMNMNWQNNRLKLGAGIRNDRVRQDAAGTSDSDFSDSHISGIFHLSFALYDDWELYTQLSSGYRFPQATERYFSGTTARGTVRGNPGLENEAVKGIELGIHRAGRSIDIQASLFRHRIRDYIERLRLSQDEITYINLQRGHIEGIEVEARLLTGSYYLSASGHYLRSDSSQGDTLDDIPAPMIQLSVSHEGLSFDWQLTYQHRFEWKNQSVNELPLDPSRNLSFKWQKDLSENWMLSLWGSNLLNDDYRLTADDRSPQSTGRGFGISINYAPDRQ